MLHGQRQLYSEIEKDVETRFDTSNYEIERPKGKNKRVIILIKDEEGEKIMKKQTNKQTKILH